MSLGPPENIQLIRNIVSWEYFCFWFIYFCNHLWSQITIVLTNFDFSFLSPSDNRFHQAWKVIHNRSWPYMRNAVLFLCRSPECSLKFSSSTQSYWESVSNVKKSLIFLPYYGQKKLRFDWISAQGIFLDLGQNVFTFSHSLESCFRIYMKN